MACEMVGNVNRAHAKLKRGFGRGRGGNEWLTKQWCIQGHPGKGKDGIWEGLKDDRARAAVMVDFQPLAGGRAGELAARFDVALGLTPEV